MGQEKIEVRANPVALGQSHLYLVYTDKNGDESYARGGPSGSGPVGSSGQSSGVSSGDKSYGNIVTDHGKYEPNTIDWNPDPNQKRTVVAQGSDLSATWQNITNQMDLIQNARIPYSPAGPNSNSVVYTALKNSGVKLVLPKGVSAIGDGTQLIDKGGKRLASQIPNETTAVASASPDSVMTQPPSSINYAAVVKNLTDQVGLENLGLVLKEGANDPGFRDWLSTPQAEAELKEVFSSKAQTQVLALEQER